MFNEPHNKFIKAIEHAAARWWRSILLTPVLLVQPSVRPSWTLMRIKYQVPPAHLFRFVYWKWWRGKWNWSINRHFYYQPVHDRRRRLFAELNVTPEQSTCRASSSSFSATRYIVIRNSTVRVGCIAPGDHSFPFLWTINKFIIKVSQFEMRGYWFHLLNQMPEEY